MIGYLRGEVQWVDLESLILVASGVGYDLLCTPETLTTVVVGEPLELWVYTQVRDDAIQLYGFRSLEAKQMFLSLIKVNGVGPRSAMHILAASPVEKLIEMINQGDAKGLSGLPKVGKKTAEQIVLTLKGKLVQIEEQTKPAAGKVRGEIISALVHLGFRLHDVEKVVERMPLDVELEKGIRDGLSALTV